MKDHSVTNDDIVAKANNMSLDELEHSQQTYTRTQTAHEKHRAPLYVIVAVALVIGTVNSLYFGSGAVFIMCLIFGGGTLAFLWLTRNNPALPRTHKEKNHE